MVHLVLMVTRSTRSIRSTQTTRTTPLTPLAPFCLPSLASPPLTRFASPHSLHLPSLASSPPLTRSPRLQFGLTTHSKVSTSSGLYRVFGDYEDCKVPALRKRWRYCYGGASSLTVVRAALKIVGMTETKATSEEYQLTWGLADEMNRNSYMHWRQMLPYNRINHLPAIGELGFKTKLQKNLLAAHDRFGSNAGKPGAFDFFPVSYSVPSEQKKFEVEYRRVKAANPEQLWIMKSIFTDRGEGIRLIRDLDQMPGDDGEIERSVMQTYIQYPYLLNGYKSTLRVYVVVVSLDPLRLYLYDNGFVHMATTK